MAARSPIRSARAPVAEEQGAAAEEVFGGRADVRPVDGFDADDREDESQNRDARPPWQKGTKRVVVQKIFSYRGFGSTFLKGGKKLKN